MVLFWEERLFTCEPFTSFIYRCSVAWGCLRTMTLVIFACSSRHRETVKTSNFLCYVFPMSLGGPQGTKGLLFPHGELLLRLMQEWKAHLPFPLPWVAAEGRDKTDHTNHLSQLLPLCLNMWTSSDISCRLLFIYWREKGSVKQTNAKTGRLIPVRR